MSASVQPAAAPAFPAYVDDGKPVESVRARGANRAARLTIIGTLLGGLLVGYWWGGIVVDRKSYNRMIDDAGQIKTEVEQMSKTLNAINDALLKNQQKFPNGAYDPELMATLQGLGDLKAPDQNKLFRTNYARFEDIAIDELFNYYNDTIALYEQIRRHIAFTDKEKDLLTQAAAAAKAQDVSYGVVVEPGKLTQGKMVQMVQKVCKGGKTDCTNVADLEGFMVTYSPGGTPFKAVFAGNGPKVIPLEMTQMMQGMIEGAKPEAIAAQDYRRRLNQIRVLALMKLPQVQKSLMAHLEETAKKPKLGTLF